MTERAVTYTATVHDDSDGLWAEVAELPSVSATGINLAELSAVPREGVELYLSTPETPCGSRRSAALPNSGPLAPDGGLILLAESAMICASVAGWDRNGWCPQASSTIRVAFAACARWRVAGIARSSVQTT
jgi:hypothetical protein